MSKYVRTPSCPPHYIRGIRCIDQHGELGIDNLPARHLGVHPDLRGGLIWDRVPEGLPQGIPDFSVGSLFFGLFPELLGSFPVLIGSREFQAVGAAMIAAIGPAMVTAYFPMEQKGKAMGIVLAFSSIGTIVGPSIGGVLCQYLSWNWIFFISIPLGIAAILLGAKVIPTTGFVKRTEGFDRTGAALIFVGPASLLFALSKGQTFGWTAPAIIMAFALAMLTLGSFIYYELRAPDPLAQIAPVYTKELSHDQCDHHSDLFQLWRPQLLASPSA
jgi:MFS family permease